MQSQVSKYLFLLLAITFSVPSFAETSNEEWLQPVKKAHSFPHKYILANREKGDPAKLEELAKKLETEVLKLEDSAAPAAAKESAFELILSVYGYGVYLDSQRFAPHLRAVAAAVSDKHPKTDAAGYAESLVFELDVDKHGATDAMKTRLIAYGTGYGNGQTLSQLVKAFIRNAADKDPKLALETLSELRRTFKADEEEFEELRRQVEQIGSVKNLSAKSITGEVLNHETLKGKVVLIDLWSTTCPPCRAMTPHLKALYEKHKADGLVIIGASVDQDLEDLEGYVTKAEVTWPQIFLPFGPSQEKFIEKYNFGSATPSLIAIDRDGKVASIVLNKFTHAKQTVEALLKKEAAK